MYIPQLALKLVPANNMLFLIFLLAVIIAMVILISAQTKTGGDPTGDFPMLQAAKSE